ncbi:hypothetical protein [Streptomyces albogriseolus]|uniref:hypothetical protein n=1 Tax=Streptomyces albogriseolus TaxID=1887 RepID=UPI00368089CC
MLTGDALHTQHEHGAYLRRRGAHYLAVVKKNHPGLYAQVRKLSWADIPLGHRTRDTAHHRHEIRRLKVAAFCHLDYPGVRQAIQVVRWRREMSTGKLTIERVYLTTSWTSSTRTRPNSPPGSEAIGASRTFYITSVTAPSARTTPRSAPVTCPAPWPASAT